MSNLLAKFQQAQLLHRQGQLSRAQTACDKILNVHPTHLDTLLLSAQIAGQTGNLERAAALLDKAIALAPGHATALCNRGLALQGLGRLEAALDSYDRALRIKQDYAIAHFNRANLLKELDRFDDALRGYERSVACNPGFARAHYNQGVLLQQLSDLDAASASYDRAIALDKNFAEALFNRGVIYQQRKQWTDALADYDRAISLRSGYVEAHCNRGVVLLRMERLNDALASCDTAISLRADYAEAYSNRGIVLHRQNRLQESLQSFDAAIALKRDFANAYTNRGHVLRDLKDFAAAIESYDRAVDLGSDSTGLRGLRRHARLQVCDWADVDAELDVIALEIDRGVAAAPPFHMLVSSDSPRLQRRAAEAWARIENPPTAALPAIGRRERRPTIHVGYFSADFRNHATSYLISELFELHDRERFEVTAFSFGPDSPDPLRQRVVSACDHFVDLNGRSDREVAQLARNRNIDIAVDLMGYTNHSRPGMFAMRAAPVQVSYLGYPGTMGVPYMDYLIADSTVIPQGEESDYAEKIIRLPDCYQVNDRKRCVADTVFTREELGLPREGFVFCCFNNSCKINPLTFGRWMRILSKVEGSVLWLLEDNATASRNLRREAEQRGVSPGRLVFGARLPNAAHLARHRAADLFLDSFPYNAHTTASDALWAGLPLLTWRGSSFAGRVAASLLESVGLPELIAATPAEYEALAIHFATDPARLQEFKSRLAEGRLSAALFDTPRFARHLEAALQWIHDRHLAGLAADHLRV
jgi:predicted O-linked N-acetylglucosamine transferase (SPINDLY family)